MRKSSCYPRGSPAPGASANLVDPIIGLAQVLASIGLIAAVLLQSRGAGLGATFGGESTVYRSRRGVEKRLFQFTIALALLFVAISMVTFITSS
jgi:preprotein translocase subunit SecG